MNIVSALIMYFWFNSVFENYQILLIPNIIIKNLSILRELEQLRHLYCKDWIKLNPSKASSIF